MTREERLELYCQLTGLTIEGMERDIQYGVEVPDVTQIEGVDVFVTAVHNGYNHFEVIKDNKEVVEIHQGFTDTPVEQDALKYAVLFYKSYGHSIHEPLAM